jgi:alkanesulfonate monooxygenase SsuD/methylene tetrahydromethanopterin reductase-like flavin-dependent oxidoreductase (luciferase family)
VWFGGHSVAAVRRTGRLGDGWLPSFVTPQEYKAKADIIRETAADAGREIDEEHFGALVAYVPEHSRVEPATIIEAVAARRPAVPVEEIIVMGGTTALGERLQAFVEEGASKFVVLPLVAPTDWRSELTEVRESVAAPLES